MDRGVIYYAIGERYLREAMKSVQSLKSTTDIDVTLFTDQKVKTDEFDTVIELETQSEPFLHFISCLQDTPYDRTIFLDTDTYIAEDISALFDLLDRFELCLSLAPSWNKVKGASPLWDRAPDSFPVFNTGVIPYRKSSSVMELFSRWEELFEQHLDETGDQRAFRAALWESDVSFGVIPTEYNCRFPFPGFLNRKVKVLHGRSNSLPEMADRFNKKETMRVFTGHTDRRIIAHPSPMVTIKYAGPSLFRYRLRVLRKMVRNKGLLHTIKLMLRRIPRMFQ